MQDIRCVFALFCVDICFAFLHELGISRAVATHVSQWFSSSCEDRFRRLNGDYLDSSEGRRTLLSLGHDVLPNGPVCIFWDSVSLVLL